MQLTHTFDNLFLSIKKSATLFMSLYYTYKKLLMSERRWLPSKGK
jgi:hypothetical protein